MTERSQSGTGGPTPPIVFFSSPKFAIPRSTYVYIKKLRRLKRSCLLSALRYLLVIFEGQVQTNVLMNLLSPRK